MSYCTKKNSNYTSHIIPLYCFSLSGILLNGLLQSLQSLSPKSTSTLKFTVPETTIIFFHCSHGFHGSWEVQAAKRWNHLGMTTLCSCSQCSCSWCWCLTLAAMVASKPWLANTQWYPALGQAYKIYKYSIIASIDISDWIFWFNIFKMCKIATLILKKFLKTQKRLQVLLDNLRRPNWI